MAGQRAQTTQAGVPGFCKASSCWWDKASSYSSVREPTLTVAETLTTPLHICQMFLWEERNSHSCWCPPGHRLLRGNWQVAHWQKVLPGCCTHLTFLPLLTKDGSPTTSNFPGKSVCDRSMARGVSKYCWAVLLISRSSEGPGQTWLSC